MLAAIRMRKSANAARLLALLALWASAAEAEPGPPAVGSTGGIAEIRIEPGRVEHRAGETLDVSVRLLDPRGEPVDGNVALDCDLGALGELSRVGAGRYRASLALPQVLPRTRSLLIVARAGAAFSELTVPLAAGPPASIDVSAPTVAPAATSLRLDVVIRDAFGNAAAAEPRAWANLGAVGPARGTEPGRWEIEYASARRLDEAEDVITIEADQVRATHALRLVPRRAWLAVAPWSGAAFVEGGTAALAVGAGAAWWWRADPGDLGIVLDVAWWRLEETTGVSVSGADAQLAGKRSYLPVTAALAWGYRPATRGLGWVAVGGGAARVATSQQLAGQPAISEAGWGPAARAAAGLGLRALGGLPFLEVRGVWIGDPGLVTVTGPGRAVLLSAGYRFDAR